MMDQAPIIFAIGAALAGFAVLAVPSLSRAHRARRRALQTLDQIAASSAMTDVSGGRARTRHPEARPPTGDPAPSTMSKGVDDAGLLRWFGLLAGAFLALSLIEFGMLVVSAQVELALIAAAAGMGYLAPGFVLVIQRRRISTKHRRAFPDILDWILICIDSGLGFEDAIERVARQAIQWDRGLGVDWLRLSAEIRAGRPVPDAMAAFAARVEVSEIAAFSSTLGQWRELGVSVSEALRGHVEDFRERRLVDAEAVAQSMPAKLVLPIALFIFPVIIVVIMLPAVLGLTAVRL